MDRSEMKLLLEKGNAQMNDELYQDALASIMKAINLCRCKPMSHGRDKSCNISQCISAIRKSDSDPDVFYRVVNGPCSCGFSWPVCSRSLHHEAVDTLAACLEKAKRFSAAFSTALGLIRLSPSSAIGYCRVAKMIRYVVKNHESSDQVVARSISALLRDAQLVDIKKLRDSLSLFVKCALQKTSKSDKYHTVLRQMSHSLKLPESRKDPFTQVPRELISIIFSHLSLTDILRCCRVNKSWRQIIEADTMLWSSITLKKPEKSKHFREFLQRHQMVRKLTIHNISRLALDASKLATILRLPRLQQLCVAGDGCLSESGGEDINLVKTHHIAPLEKLSVLLRSGQWRVPTWSEFILRISATLQVLELTAGAAWRFSSVIRHNSLEIPNLKKLYLRLNKEDPQFPAEGLELPAIAKGCPNLEYLYLDGSMIHKSDDVPDFRSLKAVSIGSECRIWAPHEAHEWVLTPALLPTTLRVVELMSVDPRLCKMLLFGDASDPPRQFTNLEVLKCKCPLTADQFEQLAELGLQNDTVRVLELAMDYFDLTGRALDTDPSKAYPQAASDRVHTVGLYGFKWEYANELTAEPFIKWLGRFPKTTTVAAYPVQTNDGVLSFFRRLISHPGIEVIHQDSLRGVEYDIVREMADNMGVQLFHTPKHTPIGWPLGIN